MRNPASEKLEIIRPVESPHLPVRRTLAMLGTPSSTRYDWYAGWSDGGIDAQAGHSPRPASVWNRIPDKVREDVVDFALEQEDLTPRDLSIPCFQGNCGEAGALKTARTAMASK